MWELWSFEDLSSVILQFLHPMSRDVLHLKLTSSVLQHFIEKTVPLHHIVSILSCIGKNQQPIPLVSLPTDFTLNQLHIHGIQTFLHYFQQQNAQEHAAKHLMTKFIFKFHTFPFISEFLSLKCDLHFFSVLVGEHPDYNIYTVFQKLQTWNRLKQVMAIQKHRCIVTKQWVEMDWKSVFYESDSIVIDQFKVRIDVPADSSLLYSVMENRDLFLFLLSENALFSSWDMETLLQLITSHPKWQLYKQDLSVRQMMLKRMSTALEQLCTEHFELQNCNDVKTLVQLVRCQGEALQYLSTTMKKNKAIVMEAVTHSNTAIQYADEELKTNKEFIFDVCKANIFAFTFVIQYFSTDEQFMLQVYHLNSRALHDIPNAIRTKWLQDHEFVLDAVTNRGFPLHDVIRWNSSYANDKNVVLQGIKTSNIHLLDISTELQNDIEVVKAAVSRNSRQIKYTSNALRNNKQLALIALQRRPSMFSFIGSELQSDLEVILAAVRIQSASLQYSIGIQDDYEKVKQVVQVNGRCYQYLHEKWRNDANLIEIAVKSNATVLKHFSEENKKKYLPFAMEFYSV